MLFRSKGLAYNIGVDGGIDFKTVGECARVGADTFISGTTLFGRPNLAAAVKKMRKIVETARVNVCGAGASTGKNREPAFAPRLF